MASHLWNGETITKLETWLDQHFDGLEDIVRAVKNTEAQDEYLRRKGAVLLDGAGAGVARIDVPQGFDWLLERVTLTSPGNGMCLFYENNVANTELLEVVGSSQLYSDAFSNNIYVPAGSTLVIAFTNAGANGTATYNVQIKSFKRRAHTQAPVVVRTGDY